MNAIAMTVYFIVRIRCYQSIQQWKNILILIGRMTLFFLLGCEMSSLVFLPSVMAFLTSVRSGMPTIGSNTLFSYPDSWFAKLYVYFITPSKAPGFWVHHGYMAITYLALVLLFFQKKHSWLKAMFIIRAKFWPSILNGLKNRGVNDILIACVDGLTGFPQAIGAVYPQTEIQQCIIHQIRNTTEFVSYKEIKPLMADLKRVYTAPTEDAALGTLEDSGEKWDVKYPKISKSWRENWVNLSTYFKYPKAVRRLIYTTDTIEGFNRQLRKVTKSKTVFPSDDSLLKMLYLAMMDITKKWTATARTGDRTIHS